MSGDKKTVERMIELAIPLVVGDKQLSRCVVKVDEYTWAFGVAEVNNKTSFNEEGRFNFDHIAHWIELILSDNPDAKKVDMVVKKVAAGAALLLLLHGYMGREPGQDAA